MINLGSEPGCQLIRQPEPELMAGDQQARAYAEADFEEPHNQFIQCLQTALPSLPLTGTALDLGCGPADIALRFAHAFPRWSVDGWDASEAMLLYGDQAVERAGLQNRVKLKNVYLPVQDPQIKRETKHYPLIFANSLLHHLADPMVLWTEIQRWAMTGAAVFIMDLLRPDTQKQATQLVEQYAQNEPEILRRDFLNSLLAAYRLDEVVAQLHQAGLGQLQVQVVSDRHFIVWGEVP
ncbi:MAG: class I SAM-dependent methyltransferase [Acaryochloris sp. RU_4_1]|nr:class I SAM-dependent methyltransferase [Acaryochloris sp. SU_5_25]NJM64986.1 class I SAM-dependent methyltransferase [Acaryochloris sp. RU_4_1]NJR56142.1 class I SAM-dependent methyltransferase [Acaryochloris sp. CRU_2_0]